MRTTYLLVLLFLLSRAPVSLCQDVLTGTLDRDRITAGQKFHLKVHFPQAPSYDTWGQQLLNYMPVNGVPARPDPGVIFCYSTFKANTSDVDLLCSVPTDIVGGIYGAINQFTVGPPPGGTHQPTFKLDIKDIEVVPIPDTNVYPTSAIATISFDQQQILKSGASKFGSLLDQLNTGVEGRSAETAELKAYLLKVASAGKSELGKIREQYRQSLPKDKKEPIFFEDFDRQFDDYIKGLRAPKTAMVEEQSGGSAHLQFVQLTTQDTVTVHPSSTDSSLGPFVGQLTALLANVRDALKIIADSESDTFTISLKSTPSGAAISYKRLREPYQDYSSSTDVDKASFPYAMWTFRFTINDCCVIKRPNPYIEKSPNLDPSMNECLKVAECKAK